MKLLNLPITIGFASLLSTLVSAKITFTEMPATVQVGELYEVEYTSDREYVSYQHRSQVFVVFRYNINNLFLGSQRLPRHAPGRQVRRASGRHRRPLHKPQRRQN
jgi:hypothetical protein